MTDPMTDRKTRTEPKMSEFTATVDNVVGVAPPDPVLSVFPPVDATVAAAAAAAEHRMMAVNGTSNLVQFNSTPG